MALLSSSALLETVHLCRDRFHCRAGAQSAAHNYESQPFSCFYCLEETLRASVKYRPYLLHYSSAYVMWLVLFRPDLSPSNATQHSARIVQHTKIKMPFYVKQWVLNLSFRGPTICKIIKTLADWKLEFIVPVFLISLNVNGFMLSAGNNSPHKTHYSLFSLNTGLMLPGLYFLFFFIFLFMVCPFVL